jgi:hypothetical protein
MLVTMSSYPETLEDWERLRANEAKLAQDQLRRYPEQLNVCQGRDIATLDLLNATLQLLLQDADDEEVTNVSSGMGKDSTA